jgi:hypothetical protein
VSAYDVDAEGDEVYLLRSAEHGRAYVLKEHALEELGDIDILPGSLEANPRLDPTTGLHTCLIEIWLPDFPCEWSQHRRGVSAQSRAQTTNGASGQFRSREIHQ